MCHLISSSSEVGIVLTSTLEDGQIKNMKKTLMCESFWVAEKERPGVSQAQSSHSYPAIIFAFYLCIVYIYYFLSSSLESLDPCRVQIYKLLGNSSPVGRWLHERNFCPAFKAIF